MRLPLLALVLALAGCDGATTTVDARFSTPEHTVDTMLRAYGVEDATQEQIREQISAHGHFELRDRASYEACFEDMHDGPVDEGLAGFVFGALAAGREDLRFMTHGDRATVSPREGVEIVMHRGDDGAYRVVISESVPAEVRAQMAAVAGHAEDRARRGVPE
jgi:hypothetical protein